MNSLQISSNEVMPISHPRARIIRIVNKKTLHNVADISIMITHLIEVNTKVLHLRKGVNGIPANDKFYIS